MQNELTFRQMVDGISALVAVLTPDGAVEFVNRKVLDYFGKTLEELKEWASTDAVHPDDLPGVIAVWRQSVQSGQPYDIELRQRRADSVYRWFHVQGLPMRDAAGHVIGWCVLQTDVDERKRAEEALHESERELRQLIDSVPGMITVANSAGQQEYANLSLDRRGAWRPSLGNRERGRRDDIQFYSSAGCGRLVVTQAYEQIRPIMSLPSDMRPPELCGWRQAVADRQTAFRSNDPVR